MAELFHTAVVAQRTVSRDHFEMILASHPALAATRPGQFIKVRVAAEGSLDPLLRRPFSLYRRFPNGNCSFVYRVVGRGTAALARLKPGDSLNILGPLGQGFREFRDAERIALVGGGVGVPPLLYYAQTMRASVEMKALLGFGTRELHFGSDAFAELGVECRVATDDGSMGHHGLVTDLLLSLLEARWCDAIVACGPKPMLVAVAALAARFGVPAQLAFEEAMACGVGACLSCVLPVRTPEGTRYARVCTEGPVFWAEEVVFGG